MLHRQLRQSQLFFSFGFLSFSFFSCFLGFNRFDFSLNFLLFFFFSLVNACLLQLFRASNCILVFLMFFSQLHVFFSPLFQFFLDFFCPVLDSLVTISFVFFHPPLVVFVNNPVFNVCAKQVLKGNTTEAVVSTKTVLSSQHTNHNINTTYFVELRSFDHVRNQPTAWR